MEADAEDRELSDLCAEILENWNTPIYSELEIMLQNPFSLHQTFNQVQQQPKSKALNVETKILKPKRKNQDLDRPIIPLLIADTFYDRLLGHSTDGIDIASLTREAAEDDAGKPTVTPCKPKEVAQKPSVHENCNNPMMNTMSKQEHRCGEGPTAVRLWMYIQKLRVMLYSNKTISLDEFGEKMWRNPGMDVTDYFNYGLDEKHWKNYYKKMHALIHEGSSGGSKIYSDTSSDSTIEDGEICE